MARLFLLAAVFYCVAVLAISYNLELADAAADPNAVSVSDEKFNGYARGARQGSLTQSQCPSACSNRCSQTSKRKACMFFCQKCCAKCLCVPPGTYGNKQVCPCYNDWKTQQGGPKCP